MTNLFYFAPGWTGLEIHIREVHQQKMTSLQELKSFENSRKILIHVRTLSDNNNVSKEMMQNEKTSSHTFLNPTFQVFNGDID